MFHVIVMTKKVTQFDFSVQEAKRKRQYLKLRIVQISVVISKQGLAILF